MYRMSKKLYFCVFLVKNFQNFFQKSPIRGILIRFLENFRQKNAKVQFFAHPVIFGRNTSGKNIRESLGKNFARFGGGDHPAPNLLD
jgi:hypothetical protein